MLYVAFLYLPIGVALAATVSTEDAGVDSGRKLTPVEEITVRIVFALVWLPIIAAILITEQGKK